MTARQADNASSDFIPADVRQTVVAQALPKGQVSIVRLKSLRRNSGHRALSTGEFGSHRVAVAPVRRTGSVARRPRAPFVPYGAGTVTVYDLDREWVADLKGAFDCLHFHMPRPLLEETVDDLGGRQRPRLYLPPHLSAHDPIIHSLGQSRCPRSRGRARRRRSSSITSSRVPGARRPPLWRRQRATGKDVRKLTPSQERRAKELLLEHLDGNLGLADVASACGLSRSYFVKAFHRTTGLPPHRWLIVQRVERAKEWMRNPSLPLSMIADACGFADQSHSRGPSRA